jgi:hypothetical protein
LESTLTTFRCFHCDAGVGEKEIADGWCDSCGKRVPLSFAEALRKNRPTPPQPRPEDLPDKGNGPWWVMGGLAAFALIGMAGLILVFLFAQQG